MTPPAIAIRPYRPDDFVALTALMIELQEYERRITPWRAPADAAFATWYIGRMVQALADCGGTLLVAADGDAPCGYAAGFAEDEPEMRDQYFHIAELVVAETHRGRGIGTRLIGALENTARALGLRRAGIGVLTGNDRAHGLYRRLGYRDHAITLRKPL